MKRLLAAICLLALPAFGQSIVFDKPIEAPGFTTGGVPVGGAPGGADTQIQFNNAGSFAGSAAMVYAVATGNVTITQQGVAGVPLTINGIANQTGSLLNLTGGATPGNAFPGALVINQTLPASPTGAASGISATITSAGSAAQNQYGMKLSIGAGFTGAKQTATIWAENSAAGTAGTNLVDYNAGLYARAISTAANIGTLGYAYNGTANYGLVGWGDASTHVVGVYGKGNAGATTQIGGYFQIGNSYTPPTTSFKAALVADNVDVAAPIFLARDNGTTKFAVNNGGLTEISLLQADMPTDGSKGALTVSTTLPASPSAAVSGSMVDVTGAGTFTHDSYALRVRYLAGYTGLHHTAAVEGRNSTLAGDGNANGVNNADFPIGVFGLSDNGVAGKPIVGVMGRASGNPGLNFGVVGSSLSYFTIGFGGFFTNDSIALPTGIGAALGADNGGVASPIFLARDNGTTVFSVEDNGPVKWTQATGASTMTVGSNQEALTLSVGGAATNTAGNLAPALSRIKAITYRVTTTITTAASYTVTITGGAAWKDMALASTTITNLTAGQTGVLVPGTFGDDFNAAATTLTVTCNTTPGAGAIRFTVWYETYAAPSS